MDKNLLYIVIKIEDEEYRDYANRLWEFIISLRYLANYRGEIVVFDYGSTPSVLDKLSQYGVEIIKISPARGDIPVTHNLTNIRNIDVIPHLEQFREYKLCTYDIDSWFQYSIDSLFKGMTSREGCYYSAELGRTCRYRGPDNNSTEQKYNEISKRLGGFIWGGFQGGLYEPFIHKLEAIKKGFYEDHWKLNIWGTDQSLITYLIDFEKDIYNCYKWGFEYYTSKIEDNKIVSAVDWYKGPVNVIHMNASLNGGESDLFRFKNLHPDLWNKYK